MQKYSGSYKNLIEKHTNDHFENKLQRWSTFILNEKAPFA